MPSAPPGKHSNDAPTSRPVADWMAEVREGVFSFRNTRDNPGLLAFLEQKSAEADNLDALRALPRDFLASLYNEFGLALAVAKEYERAEASFDEALSLNPANINALYNKANLALSRQQFDAALALFARVLEEQPEHAGAVYRAGLCRSMLGRPEEALPLFEQAARLDPEFPAPHYWAGECLLHAGEYARALPYFTRAAQLSPTHGDALRGQAICELENGRPDAALHTCEVLLKMDGPAQFLALRIKGDALIAKGEIEAAARCHLKMAALDIEAREFLLARAKALAESGTPTNIYIDAILQDIPEMGAALARWRSPS